MTAPLDYAQMAADPRTGLDRMSWRFHDLAAQESRRRAWLVECAIVYLAERGQRVELLEYHRDNFGIDSRCDLIVAGDVARSVVF